VRGNLFDVALPPGAAGAPAVTFSAAAAAG
jgi:hypothetical protein